MSDLYKQHWETIFSTKAETDVSWFQTYPATSMAFVEGAGLPAHAAIIDVGGGDSRFVDALLHKGYHNIYVLDISENAIARAKQRLGKRADTVHWIVADVMDFTAPVAFDFWHDRAAFHFLTKAEAVSNYITIASGALKKNGVLTLGTFSDKGPKTCSGLPIQQYTEATMSAHFNKGFSKIKCITENHVTPSQSLQNFQFCSFKRK